MVSVPCTRIVRRAAIANGDDMHDSRRACWPSSRGAATRPESCAHSSVPLARSDRHGRRCPLAGRVEQGALL